MPAKLGNKAAARLQRAENPLDDRAGIAHPMEGGVGEDRVECAVERQLLAIHPPRFDAARSRGREQRFADVDPENADAPPLELLRHHAVAAAKVENALAGLRLKPFQHRSSEIGYEPRVLFIILGVPDLARPRIADGHWPLWLWPWFSGAG
jgi:hypothetical protein